MVLNHGGQKRMLAVSELFIHFLLAHIGLIVNLSRNEWIRAGGRTGWLSGPLHTPSTFHALL